MNYGDIVCAIRENKPFKHNGTLTGVIDYIDGSDKDRLGITGADDIDECYYCIYSYNTLIFAKNLQNGKHWLDDQKYSRTTSRQQNLIKQAKGLK